MRYSKLPINTVFRPVYRNYRDHRSGLLDATFDGAALGGYSTAALVTTAADSTPNQLEQKAA